MWKRKKEKSGRFRGLFRESVGGTDNIQKGTKWKERNFSFGQKTQRLGKGRAGDVRGFPKLQVVNKMRALGWGNPVVLREERRPPEGNNERKFARAKVPFEKELGLYREIGGYVHACSGRERRDPIGGWFGKGERFRFKKKKV